MLSGRDLDLPSASEEEDASMGADDERDDEDEDDSHPFDEDEPLITKATVGYGPRPQNKLSVAPEVNSDSVTESETEPETELEGLLQAKKADEDSVTESEDELVVANKKPSGQVADQEDSVTEPETEDELGGQPSRILAKAYHRFECTRRYGLTGTAIQNSYDELWTILDWTNPGYLGKLKQWRGYVTIPLQAGQSTSATEEERLKALEVAKILKDKLLPRYFLRRTKDIIKDQMPKKTDQVVFCPLAAEQMRAYKRILEMEPVQQLLRKDEPCSCGSKKKCVSSRPPARGMQ
ncbi:hypothetical protein AAF712_007504 [Marasmius tenuissimus]|uniref:SNF2 N-terminal domain-containing protein n=1 Tax=Marasmius tenuissimus TaxID=585030 RepID=A0ABR2ZVU6_9AGAR